MLLKYVISQYLSFTSVWTTKKRGGLLNCQNLTTALLNHLNSLCTSQEAARITASSNIQRVSFQCMLAHCFVAVCLFFPQVYLHFFKPMPFCSTWRTGWPNRNFRHFSSLEFHSLLAWSSSQWFISHTQVRMSTHVFKVLLKQEAVVGMWKEWLALVMLKNY